MLDAAVEIGIKLGDWYFGGMFVVTFAAAGIAWKLKNEPVVAGVALVVAFVAFVATVPAYVQARDKCEALLDRASTSSIFVNNGPTASSARLEYWTSNCVALLHRSV